MGTANVVIQESSEHRDFTDLCRATPSSPKGKFYQKKHCFDVFWHLVAKRMWGPVKPVKPVNVSVCRLFHWWRPAGESRGERRKAEKEVWTKEGGHVDGNGVNSEQPEKTASPTCLFTPPFPPGFPLLLLSRLFFSP